METKNGWPEKFELFHPMEVVRKVGRFLFNQFVDEPPAYTSDHYRPPTVLEGTYLTPMMPPYDADGRYMNNQGIEG